MLYADGKQLRWLWLILFAGLILRLLYAADQPTVSLFRHGGGGDSGWYLANGAGFFSGMEHGYTRGIAFYISNLPTPPAYILFAGIFQTFLPKHESVILLRLAQCLISIATAYLAFRIATAIAADTGPGLIAAALMAFHPAFVIEASIIATETTYIFFIAMGLWLHCEYVIRPRRISCPPRLSPLLAAILTALAFGMATLTRAVAALFPLLIIAHMTLTMTKNAHGRLRACLLHLLVYCALLSTWTVYNLAMWDRFVILSDQLMPAIWRAAVTNDGSPVENDAILLQDADSPAEDDCEIDCKFQHSAEAYITQIQASVGDSPGAFVLRRLRELSSSLLQPHGTASIGSMSVGEAAADWLRGERTAGGLMNLARIDGFAIKLSIWILHLFGIIFGLAGIWMTRKSWRMTLPLVGFLAYTLLAHFVVLDSPRYLFPLEIIWLIFASIAAYCLARRLGVAHTQNRKAQ